MTDEQPRPDYSELLRSPYDPDPDAHERKEGQSDLPWVPAAIAAVLGALVVSALVIYAVVSDPEPEAAEDPAVVTTTTIPEPEQSSALPEGFTQVDAEVGARVDGIDVSAAGTVVAVATAVPGGADPAEIPPLDAAYWVLDLADGSQEMRQQYPLRGALGSITVEFAPVLALRSPTLVPHIPTSIETVRVDQELDPIVPAVIEGWRIEVAPNAVVVIDRLTIGDGWGYVEWSTDGDFPAKVEVVVRFVGTDDPSTEDPDETVLTPPHLRALVQGSGVIPLAPLYGFTGSEQLVRSGEPIGSGNDPEAIVVEVDVTMPTEVQAAEPIPVTTN